MRSLWPKQKTWAVSIVVADAVSSEWWFPSGEATTVTEEGPPPTSALAEFARAKNGFVPQKKGSEWYARTILYRAAMRLRFTGNPICPGACVGWNWSSKSFPARSNYSPCGRVSQFLGPIFVSRIS